jgi:hypothetical protein
MPTPTSYVYTISTDVPSGLVSVARLRREIELSSIVTQIDYVAGGITAPGDDSLTIWFKDPLASGEKNTLDGLSSQTPNSPASGGSILGDHSGIALPDDPQNVNVTSGTVTVTSGTVDANGKILSPNNTDFLGDNTHPLRIDPTGTTTQPVSVTSLPLPAGAATQTTLASIDTKTLVSGQAVMSASYPVVIASNQTAISVTDNGGSLTIDGTVTTIQGTAASLSGYWPVRVTDGTNTMPTGDTAGRALFEKITDGTNIAAVKAASTAPVASDPALVVAISPNSSITATNPSVGSNNTSIPTSSTQVGGSDGTNLQAARVFDADSGAGTQFILGTILRKSASGGSVEAGTSSDPLRVDPTGTTTQPISATSLPLPTGAATSANQTTLGNQTTKINDGTNTATVKSASTAAVAADTALVVAISPNTPIVASNPSVSATGSSPPAQATSIGGSVTTAAPSYTTGQLSSLSLNTAGGLRVDGSSVTQPVSAASLPLPTGAATETTLSSINTKTLAAGQAAMASSSPVVIASNQTAIPVTDNGGSLTVDGTVTATQGTAASLAGYWPVRVTDGTNTMPTGDAVGRAIFEKITDGTNTATIKAASTAAVAADPALVVAISPNNTIPISAASLPLPSGAATETTLSAINTKTLSAGQAVMAASSPVVLASNQTAIPVTDNGGSLTVDGTVTANQGTAASLSGYWPVRITDGTNTLPTGDSVARSIFNQLSDGTTGPVSVKPASTAPVASDKALVVVLSPNQLAIPVTSAPENSIPGIAFGDPSLASTAQAAVRRTSYTEPAANFTGSIVSSSANDSSAGTGARQVRITWMDATGTTVGTEDVTLNGTTAVNLVTTTKCFIEKMEVLTVGSTGSNVGIITLFTGAAGGGTAVGTIAATNNQTFWAHHYVASGLVCSVTGTLIGSNSTVAGNGSVFVLKVRSLPVANQPEKQVGDFLTLHGQSSQVPRNYGSYIKVPGPARIVMYVTPVSGTSNIFRGSFDYYDS